MTVRTRIAPSPTGDPHVGTAYIALFNYCFAKANNGDFLLRIEDTDQQRSTSQSEQAIFDSLKWLGIDWNEGPDRGGDYGPYRQSERGDIYRQYAEQLIEQGHAFYCYRTQEEVEVLRQKRREQGGFSALKPSELRLSEQEVNRRQAKGMSPVVRMVVPEENGPCPVEDMLRGTIELDWGQVDAQILLKSDGLPTYHLANVVDDYLMEITHVIRGEEWINSAPKHQLLYQYFGWTMPALCHLPLLRNPDKSKLSKRKNPTSILYYQAMGFLPEAMLNYLGRMGWSMPDEREKFTLQEMVDAFDIQRVTLGGPIFDVQKLTWLNGLWIRENLSIEELVNCLQAWALNKERMLSILPQAVPRMNLLSDYVPLTTFLYSGLLDLDKTVYEELGLDESQLREILQFTLWRLESLDTWQRDEVFQTVKSLSKALDIKMKDFVSPLFLAISGSTSSLSVMDAMILLGPDLSKARLRSALHTVCGEPGKKLLRKLEKRYQSLPLDA